LVTIGVITFLLPGNLSLIRGSLQGVMGGMCQPVGSHSGIIGLRRLDLISVDGAALQLISRIPNWRVSNLIAWQG